jgi:hypothetical protein
VAIAVHSLFALAMAVQSAGASASPPDVAPADVTSQANPQVGPGQGNAMQGNAVQGYPPQANPQVGPGQGNAVQGAPAHGYVQSYPPRGYSPPVARPYVPPRGWVPGPVAAPAPASGPYAPVWAPGPVSVPPPPPPKQSDAMQTLVTGVGVFAVSYVTTAVLGGITYDGHLRCTDRGDPPRDCKWFGGMMTIPVAGPFIAIAGTNSTPRIVGLVWSGVLQLAGIGLAISGGVQHARQRRVTADGLRLRRNLHVGASPRLDGAGLQLRLRF